MQVMGTGFLVFAFWSLVATGLFLAFSALGGLRGNERVVPFIPVATAAQGWRRPAAIAMGVILTLVGAAMVLSGIYGVFATVY